MRLNLSNHVRTTTIVLLTALMGLTRGSTARAFQPLTDPIPVPIPQGTIQVKLVPVATGLVAPIYLTTAPREFEEGDRDGRRGRSDERGSGRKYIVDQTGRVLVLKNGRILDTPFLDISGLLSNLPPAFPGVPPGLFPFYDERGLLGLAFHPDFSKSDKPGFRTIYTMHNAPVTAPADFPQPPFPAGAIPNCQEVIAEWKVTDGLETVDPMSYREILRFDKPEFNHNGGTIVFGHDRYLYASIGDGGAGNDVGSGHITGSGNAQSLGTILGKIVRIDPLSPASTMDSDDMISANGAYRVPNDNPFVNTPGALHEIFAYGLRNPYRMSFDKGGDRLIVADVGQNNIEEVDIIRRGGNYGWNQKEGTFLFDPQTGFVSFDPNPDPSLIDPVVQYDHNNSENNGKSYLAAIGGFVYRGSKIPDLKGKYVFADLTGTLFDADLSSGKIEKLVDAGIFIKGFGVDEDGEIFALGSSNLGPSGPNGTDLAIKPLQDEKHDGSDD
jgi:hypothetical protein